MKAIIFFKNDNEKNKLEKYAEINKFNVIKEYMYLNDLTIFEIFDYINDQNDKIFVIFYEEFIKRISGSRFDTEFTALLSQGKIEFKYYVHPCFIEPQNDNIKIWRYMSLPKFLDLIQTQSLFFTRSDFLRKDDKSEGAYFTKFAFKLHELIENNPNSNENLKNTFKRNNQTNIWNETNFIKKIFINCWHMNDFENFAMWKIYSEIFGVCIQSTYKKLCDSFKDVNFGFYNEKNKIYIGKVNYIDGDNFLIPSDNAFWPYIHKRKEFEYENELRCIITKWDNVEILSLNIKIDTEKLIDKIYINPFSPDYFEKNFKNLCQKYGISSEKIIKSNLV